MRSILLGVFFLSLVGMAGCSSSDPVSQTTVVDVAVNAGTFTTLVTALEVTGLDVVLAGAGPFTVFAPTDAAFADLPAGTLDELLLPENRDQLEAILTYHVVPGRVGISSILSTTSAATVNGADVPVGLSVEGASVTTADISADNGIVHVINKVLLP